MPEGKIVVRGLVRAVPIFLHSFVVESATAAAIAQCINVVHYSITAVAVISDNAPAMLAATNQIFTQHATVLPLRCAAHVMNLIIKDFFKSVEFVKNCLDILEEYISRKIVNRYCETRWNSVFDRLKDLSVYLYGKDNDVEMRYYAHVQHVSEALQPFIDVLNVAQADGADWVSFYQAFSDAVTVSVSSGFDGIAAAAERRRYMVHNEIVALHQFLSGRDLQGEEEGRLSRWLQSLGVGEFCNLCGRSGISWCGSGYTTTTSPFCHSQTA